MGVHLGPLRRAQMNTPVWASVEADTVKMFRLLLLHLALERLNFLFLTTGPAQQAANTSRSIETTNHLYKVQAFVTEKWDRQPPSDPPPHPRLPYPILKQAKTKHYMKRIGSAFSFCTAAWMVCFALSSFAAWTALQSLVKIENLKRKGLNYQKFLLFSLQLSPHWRFPVVILLLPAVLFSFCPQLPTLDFFCLKTYCQTASLWKPSFDTPCLFSLQVVLLLFMLTLQLLDFLGLPDIDSICQKAANVMPKSRPSFPQILRTTLSIFVQFGPATH